MSSTVEGAKLIDYIQQAMKNEFDLYLSALNCAVETLDDEPGPTLDAKTSRTFKNDGGQEPNWFKWNTYVKEFRARFHIMREESL